LAKTLSVEELRVRVAEARGASLQRGEFKMDTPQAIS
jgi:hypothetical protein